MTIRTKLENFEIKQHHIPWILLGTSLLAYGIMIHRLGFYWDDWPTLFFASASDDPTMNHLFTFRPLHVYLDMWTVKILGYNPLSWHLLMLAIRYLGGLFFWLFLKELWPQKQQQNAWTAMLFLVYPSFLHQSMSVIYRQHFTTALLYLISMYLLVKAINSSKKGEKKQFWVFYLLSIIFGIPHLFIMEYFSAMELLRIFVILALLLREKPKAWEAVLKLLGYWLPYLIYLIGFFVWRIHATPTVVEDPNEFVLLDQFVSAPFNTLVALLQTVVLDLRQLLVGCWIDIFDTELVDISSPFNLGVLAIIAIAGVALYLLFVRFQKTSNSQEQKERTLEHFVLGIFGVFLGLAPAWLVGRTMIEGRYNARFSIPALAGVSILIVSILFSLITERKKIVLVLSILIAFAIGKQIQMNNTFRWDWERQTRAYWQLYWRAPEIEPKTAILVNKSLTGYATTYPVASALNFMYSFDNLSMTPDYWWFEIYDSGLYNRTNELLHGGVINPEMGYLQIEMNGDDSLVIFLPGISEPTKCLWLITEEDSSNPLIPKELRAMSSLTNLSRIHQNTESILPPEIFGPEPAPTWCTYYQKAQLAAQFQDWETVIRLFNITQKQGMRSTYGYEYFPFITASMEVDDWNQAVKLTLSAYRLSPHTKSGLCSIWQIYPENHQEHNDNYMMSYLEVQENLGCSIKE